MGAAIIHERNIFFLHISRLNSDAVGENFHRHPSVLICPVANWKTFPTETPNRLFAHPDDENLHFHSYWHGLCISWIHRNTLLHHHMGVVAYGTIVDSDLSAL